MKKYAKIEKEVDVSTRGLAMPGLQHEGRTMKTFETPLSQIENIYAYFHDPAHSAEIQMASDKTQYVWQHMSNYYPTEQVLRSGPIHELPEQLDPTIGKISVKFSDGTTKTVEEYFATSTMDAMLVLRAGTVVFERYKTMRPFDKHNWFSCSKSTVAVSLALLEHEGKVDVSKPVPHYLPELAGSVWDTVTVEQTLDMATGLDFDRTRGSGCPDQSRARLVQVGHEHRRARAGGGLQQVAG